MINFAPEQINRAFEKLSDEVVLVMDKINLEKKIKDFCIKEGFSKENSQHLEFLINLKIIELLNETELEKEILSMPIDNSITKNNLLVFVRDLIILLNEEIKNRRDSQELLSREITISEDNDLFDVLPLSVQEAISFSGWKKSLFQIAEKNKFNIEQSGIFEDLTIKSMRNEISSGEYRDQIKTQLSLDENKTSEVVAEVNEKIFQEIRNIMRESEVKKDDDFESFSDINDVPVPPYAKKEEPIEIKINNTSPEKIIGVEHEEDDDDTPSITRKTELSAGGIQSTDFSIPKPIINDMKNINDTSLVKPSKSHDPYREII